jgi:hypothetical protein
MKKFIILFPLFLFAAFVDFSPCLKKYDYINDSVPVSRNLSVTFNKSNCFKYDPFTGMCIIKHKNKRIVKFFYKPELAWWMASIKENEIYVGNFAKDNIFFTPAKLSVKSLKNSVISDMFCRAVGIGRGDGFIKADMIMHFVNTGYWGDIGIDVDENMKIISFDPFYVKGIKLNDKITKINDKKADFKTFQKYILTAKKNKNVNVTINNKTLKLKIRKKKYLFTPLEHYGIYVDSNLKIIKLPENIKRKYYLKNGAKIVAVNNQETTTFLQLKQLLSTYKNVTITLLVDGMTFTIPLR